MAKATPEKPTKKTKEPSWASTVYPTVLKICPTAEQKDGYALLGRLAKTYDHATIEKALTQVIDEGTELGVRSLWPVITATCKRINDSNVIRRPATRQAPVSEGNTRGRAGYGKKG